ncbi:MAG: response regulator transcription factor [Oscillospiraceae bacterium]|nr:response regulator transcription factor [Oscillospiraceae bacterium]
MENKQTILVVEDHDSASNYISAILTSSNFSVIKTAKGKEAISMAASYCPDMILLNMGLPDITGMDVLKAIRLWSDVPIIFVSSHVSENEMVEALDYGADDYVKKPFRTNELMARIRTGFRHSQKNTDVNPIRHVGEMVIDIDSRSVAISGKSIHLTPNEYKIIVLLCKNPGKVLTYDYIIKGIWGPCTKETYESELQALRVNVANIRKKIEEDPTKPKYILTEVGIGYRLSE